MTRKKYKLNRGRVLLFTILLTLSAYYLLAEITPYHFIKDMTLSQELTPILEDVLRYEDEMTPKVAYVIQPFTSKNILGQEVPYVLHLTEEGVFILKNDKKDMYNKLPKETQDALYDLKLDMMVYSDNHLPALHLNEEKVDYTGTWSIDRLNGESYEIESQTQVTEHIFSVDDMNQVFTLESIYPIEGSIDWYDGDNLMETDTLSDAFKLPTAEGTYKGLCNMEWHNAELGFQGHGTLTFMVTIDYDTEISMDKTETLQGDLVKVIATNTNGQGLSIEQSLATQVQFYKTGDTFTALIPITYRDDSGSYPIVVKENETVIFEETLTVSDRNFHIQYLVIDETIASATRNDAAYEEYNLYFPESRETSTFDYKGTPFIIPVTGRLSTEYGETRHVNGSPTSYRHSGLDLANPTGTPVVATNDGLVTLSMNLTLTGNTIVIDHGNGIFSTHFHLNERHVEKGDIVASGQSIGTVGTTGFSTGPHLHFTMSYFAQNIDPGTLIYGTYVTYDNYKKLFNP